MRSIAEAARRLRAREISVVELVKDALAAAERDSHLNAFMTVTADQALAEAAERDAELADGRDRGPLHGIPVGLKDLYFTKGVRTTNGSKLFENFVPDHDAVVVTKLRDAGAISIGKLGQHELAYGISSTNRWFGPVRNPWDPECIPGGSSGGSGAAVATGSIFAGMGSDTGGSIRNPAAYCGTVGIKPTFDRVSRDGCFGLGLSLDTMGPLTRTVEDAAIVLGAISDEDLTPNGTAALKGVRCGVPNNFFLEHLHPDVDALYRSAIRQAEELGAQLVPTDVPDPEGLNIIARTTLLCEAPASLHSYLSRRSEISPEVMTLLDQGSLLTGAEYINAQRVRRMMQRDWQAMFRTIDVLITPTSPVPAPKIGQTLVKFGEFEEDTRLASTKFLRGVNAMGLPALALPCGLTRERMPASLQLIGPAWSERRLFEYGRELEAALPVVDIKNGRTR